MCLDSKRKEISELDTLLVQILLKRLSLCQDIAFIKKDLQLPIMNQVREDQILKRVMAQCEKDPHLKTYILEILQQIMSASKKLQSKIIKDHSLW
ncbi:MAG: hypothetical protein COB02_12790 [Candidatus Cloacimonadota bacterium]|nr:MAG: hypothetical protein COB02_12790 [Candidatus Cloacimonadota bacterium]